MAGPKINRPDAADADAAVARFYEFNKIGDKGVPDVRNEGIPSDPGPVCHGSTPSEWSDITKRAGEDAAPFVVTAINRRLFDIFRCRDHYVAIERWSDGKYYHVLRWRNGQAVRKPIRLMEFDESNPLIERKGFLTLNIGGLDASIKDGDKYRTLELKDGKDAFSPIRHLVIPVCLDDIDNLGANNVLYSLSDDKGAPFDAVSQVKNGSYDNTGLYLVDIRPWEVYAKSPTAPEQKKPTIEEKQKVEKSIAAKVKEKVITSRKQTKRVDLFIVLDASCGQINEVGTLINELEDIVKGLQTNGVDDLRVGLGVFYDGDEEVRTLHEFVDANKEDALAKLYLAAFDIVEHFKRSCAVSEEVKVNEEIFKGGGDRNRQILVLSNLHNVGRHTECIRLLLEQLTKQAGDRGEVKVVHLPKEDNILDLQPGIFNNLELNDETAVKFIRRIALHSKVVKELRMKAANLLVKYDRELGINTLLEMILDGYRDLKLAALRRLLELGHKIDKATLDKFIKELRGDRDNLMEAAKILIPFDTEAAIEILRGIVLNVDDLDTRKEAIRLIGSSGEKGSDVLHRLLLSTKDRPLLLEIAKALIPFDHAAAIKVLDRLVMSYAYDEFTALEAIKVLGSLGDKAVQEIRDVALNSKHISNRVQAARALIRFDKETALKIAYEYAKGDRPAEIRLEAARIIMPFDVTAATDVFRELALHAGSDLIRLKAAEELITFDKETALKTIRDMALGSGPHFGFDWNKRLEVAKLLIPLDRPTAIKALSNIIPKAPSTGLFRDALNTLLSGGDKAELAKILSGLIVDTSDRWFRQELMGELAGLGKEGVEALNNLALNAKGLEVRLDAAETLMSFDRVKGVNALRYLLLDIGSRDYRYSTLEKISNRLNFNVVRGLMDIGDYLTVAYFHVVTKFPLEQISRGGWDLEGYYVYNSYVKSLQKTSPRLRDYLDLVLDIFAKAEGINKAYSKGIAGSIVKILLNLDLGDDLEAIKEDAQKLLDLAKGSKGGVNAGSLLAGLAIFAPQVRNLDLLIKDYVPLIKDVVNRDLNWVGSAIQLLADYKRDGHTFPETAAYRDKLLEDPSSITVEIMDMTYRLMPELIVNREDLHYYTNMVRDEGKADLTGLTMEAETEEAWIYVEYEKFGRRYQRWFEAGEAEVADKTSSDSKILRSLIEDSSVEVQTISHYHIHPVADQDMGSSAVNLMSSPEDMESAVSLFLRVRRWGYKGPFDSRAVTPFGEYILTATDAVAKMDIKAVEEEAKVKAEDYRAWLDAGKGEIIFEKDAIDGLNASGLVRATYTYHSPHMKDIHLLYAELVKIHKEEFSKGGGYIRGIDEAHALWELLDQHCKKFSGAISAAKAGGVPERLLSYYEGQLKDEFQYLASLSKLFARSN